MLCKSKQSKLSVKGYLCLLMLIILLKGIIIFSIKNNIRSQKVARIWEGLAHFGRRVRSSPWLNLTIHYVVLLLPPSTGVACVINWWVTYRQLIFFLFYFLSFLKNS